MHRKDSLIEEQLKREFETLADGTMHSVVSALKQVLWDGRKDTRAQLEDRLEQPIQSLEEEHIDE